MYAKILVTLSISITLIDSFYLQSETNYKPKLERNNIVNKGVWVRNKQGREFDKGNIGGFIFRSNSLDADNAMQTSFDLFAGPNAMQDTPYFTNYVQRTRRSPDHSRKKLPKNSIKTAMITKSSVEDDIMIKSKLVSDLKPTSVFNEYPYEVAILLNTEAGKSITKKRTETDAHKTELDYKTVNNTGFDTELKEEIKIVSLNTTNLNDTSKRSKKYDHVNDDLANLNMVEDYEKIKTATDLNIQERDLFPDKDTKIWKQNSPQTDNNFYKVVPKEPEKSKTLSERSIIKIILMLTKTFKKVMKQHNEIKVIHKDMLNIKHNFDKNLAEAIAKFEDFDSKYADMIQFNNKFKSFEEEMSSQKKIFNNKQKDIHKIVTDFQDQQKKFLVQQSQFYAIQKLMLAQNEKINARQNVIAQTQSQISHRQNNFARILKKAKQIMNDNKVKINQSYAKQQDKHITEVETSYTTAVPITTTSSANTESMKIDLFSIPTKINKLENQDALIIEEKDEKQIDDLVYKYYFNNTFIDALMKSKILNNYSTSNSVELTNRSKLSKKKRYELETTIMLPVNNSLSDSPVKRERRWINHFSKNKYKKLNRHRKVSTAILSDKNSETKHNNPSRIQGLNDFKVEDPVKSDPYLSMATNFCNQIGQNANEQVLKWCVEKALRRLKFMEMNALSPPTVSVMRNRESEPLVETTKMIEKGSSNVEQITTLNTVSPVNTLATDTQTTTASEAVSKITPVYDVSTSPQAIFFPDNEELESNLKQYDLTPDTEGNVYYDGSLHISDYGRMQPDSDGGTSDIMPGLIDSNSRVEIDPRVIDMQAKRRAYVRRINKDIMKQMKTKMN